MKSVQATANINQNQSSPLTLEKLANLPPIFSERCIYRVPNRLRMENEKAYTPQLVSIGPIHHNFNESLKPMEVHKMRYLHKYLQATHQVLDYYINIIRAQEEKLRNCYAEPIEFSSVEFVEIVLVDAVFVIMILLKSCLENSNHQLDHIFGRPWMVMDIKHDLLLIENQLPFFILEELFNPVQNCFSNELISVANLARTFFNDMTLNLQEISHQSSPKVEHFVDLLIKFSIFPLKPKSKMPLETLNLPSVANLRRSGVMFKMMKTSKTLLDVQFSKGVLEIPKLIISDHTENKLRNLVAFEQCHSRESNRYITDYVVLLDYLISTSEDVDLLVKYGIVDNQLGDSSRVAIMINKLGDGVRWSSDEFCFATIFEQLYDHYKMPWHKWKANLRQNYFYSPWSGLSVFAAVFMIVLTLIQAVCSIISIVKDTHRH